MSIGEALASLRCIENNCSEMRKMVKEHPELLTSDIVSLIDGIDWRAHDTWIRMKHKIEN